MYAVEFERHCYGAQGILAGQHVGYLRGAYVGRTLALVVEVDRVVVGTALHTVIDVHLAALELDDIDSVALQVVVPVVAFLCRESEDVGLVDVEHGVSEGVACLTRLLVLEGQGHGVLVAAQVLGNVLLVAEVVELVERHLLVGEQGGRVVDAVVLGVVLNDGLAHAVALVALPSAVQGVGVKRRSVGQVDDVTGLSLLIECGIALCVDLHDFPLHGRQLHAVFAGVGVGMQLYAMAVDVGLGLVLILCVVGLVYKHCVTLFLLLVHVVIDQPRSVVALQGHHHGNLVAEVVVRERVAEREFALFLTTHDAADEGYAGLVVEINLIFVGGEVIGKLAVVVEAVPVFLGLNGGFASKQIERELTVAVGFYGSSGSSHLAVVGREGNARHGNTCSVIHHIAREAVALGDGEDEVFCVVRLGVESDGNAIGAVGRKVILGNVDADVVGSALVGVVAQSLHFVVSAVVGAHLHGFHVGRMLLCGRHCNHHVGDARSVGEAHIAIDHTCLYAVAFHFLSIVVGQSLAVVHRAHPIIIGIDGRGGLILILRVADVGSDSLPVLVAALGAALHLEVVDGQSVSLPLQLHALLLFGPVERGQDGACGLKVVVATAEGGEGEFRQVKRCSNVNKDIRHLKAEEAIVICGIGGIVENCVFGRCDRRSEVHVKNRCPFVGFLQLGFHFPCFWKIFHIIIIGSHSDIAGHEVSVGLELHVPKSVLLVTFACIPL